MQRLYTRDEYMGRIEWMKNARRPIAITTDIIVGFPGETEQDFEETLDLLERSRVRFASSASNIRQRPNTAALHLDDHIPEEEKTRRLVDRAGEAARHPDPPQRRADRRTWKKSMWKASTRPLGQWIGRTSRNRTLNFTPRRSDDDSSSASTSDVRVTRAGPQLAGRREP